MADKDAWVEGMRGGTLLLCGLVVLLLAIAGLLLDVLAVVALDDHWKRISFGMAGIGIAFMMWGAHADRLQERIRELRGRIEQSKPG